MAVSHHSSSFKKANGPPFQRFSVSSLAHVLPSSNVIVDAKDCHMKVG